MTAAAVMRGLTVAAIITVLFCAALHAFLSPAILVSSQAGATGGAASASSDAASAPPLSFNELIWLQRQEEVAQRALRIRGCLEAAR